MTQSSSLLPVNSADIDAAARVLAPFAVRTPLLSPPGLSDRFGAKIFIKPEV
ncbi:MAG: pyridoxal-5'-phosphate-dependent protein, partial [Bradyrhizobium sp.]